MKLSDAADIIGIPSDQHKRDSELSRAAQKAAEQWIDEYTELLIHTHRMAFLDGVQYGLRWARDMRMEDER